jgi:hypothetical protein
LSANIDSNYTIRKMETIKRTKTLAFLLIIFLLGIVSKQVNAQINGYEEDIQGIHVVHVWGTDYEMGYALGYLEGDKFASIIEDIIIPSWGIEVWNQYRGCFTTNFTVPPRADEMVDGMIGGIGDRPDSVMFSPSLGRNYDDIDLHVCHALTDLSTVLYGSSSYSCTSLSAWDAATASDPELQGAPLLARNLDSDYHPLLAEMHAVITMSPDSGNKVVLFGQPMDLDCSTAMNEHGISVTRNAAYHDYISFYEPAFMPIGYAALMGLMEDDFDDSGTNDLKDLLTALTFWNRAPSKNLHVAAPRSLGYLNEPAIVVEINNDSGYVFRTARNDPVLGPAHMAATNHFRLLYPPNPCSRYDLLSDSISADPDMTLNRFWDFLGYCDIPGWHTYLSVLLLPESNKIGIAFCDSIKESWEKDPVWLTWNQLFPTTEVEPVTISSGITLNSIFPNPSIGTFSISFNIPVTSTVLFSLYDISGRLIKQLPSQEYSIGIHHVEFCNIPAGRYLCRMVSNNYEACKSILVLSH